MPDQNRMKTAMIVFLKNSQSINNVLQCLRTITRISFRLRIPQKALL